MPKESRPKAPRPPTDSTVSKSTQKRTARWNKTLAEELEMVPGCERCRRLGLRCFVEAATGRCASCTYYRQECSLFVSEEKWEKIQAARLEKELELLRSEEATARLRRELAEVKAQERSYALHDRNTQGVVDAAEGVAKPQGTETIAVTESPLSGPPPTDLGVEQADSFDPSSFFYPDLVDFSSFLANPVLLPLDAVGDILTPILCSS